MANKVIYLDYNATTPLHEDVQAIMAADFGVFGNASSMHSSGRQARARIEEARQAVAALIGANSGEIIFTSGGSESNNMVFQTMRDIAGTPAGSERSHGRNEFIITAIEHPCVLNSALYLKSLGFKVTVLPVDEYGRIRIKDLLTAINGRTLLVSVMYANNEIGVLQNIKEIARISKAAGAWVHTDAVQAAGKIPVNVNEFEADYLTLSSHKIYGPKGVGALYRRKGAPLAPLIHGGHQENGLRAGTYNNQSILGFGKAAELARINLDAYQKKTSALRKRLHEGLLSKIPDIKINGDMDDTLPNTLNVSFPGAEGEAILLSLDLKGVEVSTGSACASGSLDPSHVLMAIGVCPELAHGSVRFSLGWGNTEADIDFILEIMPPLIERLRAMSTVKSTTPP